MTEKERLALEALLVDLEHEHGFGEEPWPEPTSDNLWRFKEILERHLQSPFA